MISSSPPGISATGSSGPPAPSRRRRSTERGERSWRARSPWCGSRRARGGRSGSSGRKARSKRSCSWGKWCSSRQLYTRRVSRRLAEERSLALHRLVAERVRERPELVDEARARLRRWRAAGVVAARYADAWERLLALTVDELCRVLAVPGEPMATLRSMTPFAGVVDPRTRWRVWRQV